MKNQIITVNEKDILIISHSNEKYVAIKPICEAIGVDYSGQLQKIKEDPILASTLELTPMVGADEKQRKMQTLPLRYVFGWLFKIDSRNVKEEIRGNVLKYQKECYDILFDTFTKRASILLEKTTHQLEIQAIEKDLETDERVKKLKALKSLVKNASERLNSLDKSEVNEQLNLFKSDEDEQ